MCQLRARHEDQREIRKYGSESSVGDNMEGLIKYFIGIRIRMSRIEIVFNTDNITVLSCVLLLLSCSYCHGYCQHTVVFIVKRKSNGMKGEEGRELRTGSIWLKQGGLLIEFASKYE